MSSQVAEVGESKTLPIDDIEPYFRNPRRITPEAVEAVAVSIEEYGYQQPIVVDREHVVIVGHTRLQALKMLGYTEAEVYVCDLSEEKAREYRIVDNKTSELTSWDHNALVLELREFESSLLDRYFPDVNLEVEMVKGAQETTQGDVDRATKKALEINDNGPVATVKVTCPSCFKKFEVKATALPGISADDVAMLA